MVAIELQQAIHTLELIRQTSSLLEKKALLKSRDSVTLRKILQLTYDDRKFGFGPESKQELFSQRMSAPYQPDPWWQDILTILDQGTDVLDLTRQHSAKFQVWVAPDCHHQALLVGILIKDLRLGLRAKSILEVFPNLFEVFNVQLAKPFNQAKLVYPCAVEPKLDGVRAIYYKGRYLSRYGQDLIGPAIDCPPAWVLDGELVAGHFQDTLSAVRIGGDLRYYVFDTIPLEEWETRTFKLTNLERNKACPENIKGTEGLTRLWCTDLEAIDQVHTRNLSLGFEGSMIKANVPYELKRSYSWMKIKPTKDMDVKITDVKYGDHGKPSLTCVTLTGKEFQLGTGFTQVEQEEITSEAQEYFGLIAEITYQELTIDGIPRFARFKRWRPDKKEEL